MTTAEKNARLAAINREIANPVRPQPTDTSSCSDPNCTCCRKGKR